MFALDAAGRRIGNAVDRQRRNPDSHLRHVYGCCRILAADRRTRRRSVPKSIRRQLADSLSRRLTERYFLPPHERAEYSQTALAFAYYYCDPTLLPREKIVEKLVALVDEGRCFDAGIFGTAPMLHILAAEGYGDIRRRLLTKPEYPSYRAMLDLGATTLWEHWPVQGFDGGYEAYDGSMSHPMHAAFDEWLYTGVAGLAAAGASENHGPSAGAIFRS